MNQLMVSFMSTNCKKFDNVFKIQEILETRTLQGVKEHFVKWRGYPDSFNSWVRADNIIKLK